MSLVYPNLVPENNLRLPDALTVQYGPAELLSRFVLSCDIYARRAGLRLRVSHDFDELVYVNKHYTAEGSWYPLLYAFNPEYTDLTPENAYWIAGENEHGEVVTTRAAHIYYWPDTNLREQARLPFYGRNGGQPCIVTAEAADMISGVVWDGGAAWVRPDFRGKKLSGLLSRVSKAYGAARWPLDWLIGFAQPDIVSKGYVSVYGARHTSNSIFYPKSPWGDPLEVALLYTAVDEAYEDLAEFLATELSVVKDEAPALSLETILAQEVTSTSPETVFHGRSNLS